MDIIDTILTNTYTIQDMRHRMRILKSNLENTLFGKVQTEILSSDDTIWLSSLTLSFINYFTKDNIYSSFKNIEAELKKLKILIIYLSFEPEQEQIENIGKWLRTNLTEIKLFDIKLDPSLLGGIALVKDGVYKDYSLKTRIQEQGEMILVEFKKYIR